MALVSVRRVSELEEPFVLAPERYDPRREFLLSSTTSATPLGSLVELNRKTVSAGRGLMERCLIFDTGDAHEGILTGRRQPSSMSAIGSAKKEIRPRDVIVSRLRPYLRQVAYIDNDVPCRNHDIMMLCSTEFFVLRPVDHQSISFLAAFLLTEQVQKVLAASQEGGHHPRFNEASLLNLLVPIDLLGKRDDVSAIVEQSVRLFRESEREMMSAIELADAAIGR